MAKAFEPSGYSLYEVGRSPLNAAIPRNINIPLGWRRWALSLGPTVLGIALGVLNGVSLPHASPISFAWPMMAGASITLLMLMHFTYVRDLQSMAALHNYVITQLQPSIAFAGAIVKPSEVIGLIKRHTVQIAPQGNLYKANSMRLIRLQDGTDAVQFENIT